MGRNVRDLVVEQICPALPPRAREAVKALPDEIRQRLTEIRLRRGRPAMGVVPEGDFYLSSDGQPLWPGSGDAALNQELVASVVMCTENEWEIAMRLVTECSIYALERELAAGYITLRGGHRVGLVGRAVLEGDRIRTQRELSAANYRVARQIVGVADKVMPYILRRPGGRTSSQNQSAWPHSGLSVFSVLVLSGPGHGKTTLLRDIARQLSYGSCGRGFKVGIVDERSEIAACCGGVPGNDLGPRADIIDSCPKAQGIMIVTRSMSPDVIVTDEIGHAADSEAIEEARRCGVAVIATAHATDYDDAQRRPALRDILARGGFERAIILTSRLGVGTCERMIHLPTGADLLDAPFLLSAAAGKGCGGRVRCVER
ncbi:MAG: stage III sporulation protein AA [Firmicutes bacterium]|nr:stage III sporulation protein AA [Bacillota bacterium]MDD4337801.1 stage III sporulation protein AA [Bacillota bacterium]